MKIIYGVVTALLTGALFLFAQQAQAAVPTVLINEVMWMGSSASSNDEWIELRNTTTSPIDLSGWRLSKLSGGAEGTMLTIATGEIPAGGYFVVANESAATSRLGAEPQLVDASVSLVNTKLQIKLYGADGVLVDIADDGSGAPLAGAYQSGSMWKSMERNASGADGSLASSWHTSSFSYGFDDDLKEWGTPGAENSNQAPVLVANIPEAAGVGEHLSFDASETTDAENDPVTVRWDFGDGSTAEGLIAEHTYTAAGAYTVLAIANDGRANIEERFALVVTPPPPPPALPVSPTDATLAPIPTVPSGAMVRVHEVFPDPKGSDATGEFIELLNEGGAAVDLRGWKITDRTASYVFPSSRVLAAGAYLVLMRAETKLALKNTGGQELFLLDPSGSVHHGVKMPKAVSGKSFSRHSSMAWAWAEPTPGMPNVVEAEDQDTLAPAKAAQEAYPSRTIQEIYRAAKRTKVSVQGTVVVPPGIFATTFFYIVTDGYGLQIFSSKADFPELSIGDVIEVRGAVGEASGERKVNLTSADDIEVLDSGVTVEAQPWAKNARPGTLLVLEGEITGKRASALQVQVGGETVAVSFARGADIDTARISIGDRIRFVGIWRVTKDGAKLLPRSDEDVEVLGDVQGAATDDVLAAPPVQAQELSVALPQRPSALAQYGFPAITLLLVGGGYWVWKRRRQWQEDQPDHSE